MIQRLLIANRGEIACRLLRTAQRMGIYCIAIYSEADRLAMHVRLADEAWLLGPAPAAESYLHQTKILQIAAQAQADAVHPGYGFLAENAQFAEACLQQGLIWVGPPPEAMRAMASKADAKARMQQAQVPLIPGYHGEDQSEQTLLDAAIALGFPVLIKASAGGGGKGMRAVHHVSEFITALHAARREAFTAFADDRILLEKWVNPARHIEVQILADQQGRVLPLFDRDCSIQRRHQKVLEEAPAPGVPPQVRSAMADAAVRAATAVGYVNAGTLEFLMDAEFRFYFMEMNTRLQVEHPVTECITGLDLVEWQLRIAQGEALPFTVEDLPLQGAAVEVRLYAEDPALDFLPASGELAEFSWEEQPGLRIDTGFATGDRVSDYYDALIAKLIFKGNTRQEALHGLNRALQQLRLRGLRHNGGFLERLTRNPEVITGSIPTNFLEHHPELKISPEQIAGQPMVLWASMYLALEQRRHASTATSPWLQLTDWRLTGQAEQPIQLLHNATRYAILLKISGSLIQWRMDGQQGEVRAWLRGDCLYVESTQQLRLCGEYRENSLYIYHGGDCYAFDVVPVSAEQEARSSEHWVQAPMNGRIIEVITTKEAMVQAGSVLLIMEAMKMEHRLCAPRSGQVEQILAKPGDLVHAGQTLLTLYPD